MTDPFLLDEHPEPVPEPPGWGFGDVLGGLATSIALPLALGWVAFVLLGLGASISAVWRILFFSLCTWLGLLGWTLAATYTKGSKSLRDDFGWDWRGSDVVQGIAIGMGGLFAVAIALVAIVGTADRPQSTFAQIDPSGLAELVALGGVLIVGAPVVEELFFRGLVLRSALRRFGPVVAVLVTSVLFALVHIPDRIGSGLLVAFAPAFLLGVLLGFLAVRSGRLGPSIVAHSAVNGIVFLLAWVAPRLAPA